MVLLNVCLLTNRNVITYREVILLGPFQMSNFSCAESNANEKNLLFSLICIRFGTFETGLSVNKTNAMAYTAG